MLIDLAHDDDEDENKKSPNEKELLFVSYLSALLKSTTFPLIWQRKELLQQLGWKQRHLKSLNTLTELH